MMRQDDEKANRRTN